MTNDLRDRLSSLGVSPFDVVLPGDDDVAPLEGALHIEPSRDGWVLTTVDYGTHWTLARASDRAEAEELLVKYLERPVPGVRPAPEQELHDLAEAIARYYPELRDRATAAGPGGIVIDLPPGVPVDRIGALDGIHLYPLNTPFELRSLPPTVLRPESDVHKFVTRGDVRVGVVVTPPWFGQPGGGLRYTLQEPEVGIRDLVLAGALERVVRVA